MPAVKPLPPREGPLPVSLLSGFLGSGKTTLLKHLLQNADGLRIGALVNDVAALNIDAKLVAKEDKAKALVELENGCICCTLRDPLMEHLVKLSQDKNLDYCIIESTGVAEPAPVAEAFTLPAGEALGEDGEPIGDVPLSEFVKLDTCVTVVDAKNFPDDLETRKKAADRWKDTEELAEGERDIAEIMAEQLEFADVIILNKCDLVTEDQAARISGAVRAFNVNAPILKALNSAVNMSEVVSTGKFDIEAATQNSAWMAEMSKEPKVDENGNPRSELEEFGISSTVYRRKRPFHPERFDVAAGKLAEMGNALLRSKGFVWLATRQEGFGQWSQTGAVWTLKTGGRWLSATPRDEWPSTEPTFVEAAEKLMDPDPVIGDRRQEMVFIGQGLREKEIVDMMDSCLLTDEEMKLGPEKWIEEFCDEFEVWDFDPEDPCGDGDCDIDHNLDVDVEYEDDSDEEEESEDEDGETNGADAPKANAD